MLSTAFAGGIEVWISPPSPPMNAAAPGVYAEFCSRQGVGKSSQVSQCVQPLAPAARATATSSKLIRVIPVSFPYHGWPLAGTGATHPGLRRTEVDSPEATPTCSLTFIGREP